MKRVIAYLLVASLLATGLMAQEQARALQQDETAPLALDEGDKAKLQFAASTHELIMTRLAEGQYEAILPEFRKILALDLGGSFDQRLTQGAWLIVDELRAEGQYDLAHSIIKETLSRVSDVDSRWELLILQGKTYKEQGRFEQAITSLEEARKLRPQNHPDQ